MSTPVARSFVASVHVAASFIVLQLRTESFGQVQVAASFVLGPLVVATRAQVSASFDVFTEAWEVLTLVGAWEVSTLVGAWQVSRSVDAWKVSRSL